MKTIKIITTFSGFQLAHPGAPLSDPKKRSRNFVAEITEVPDDVSTTDLLLHLQNHFVFHLSFRKRNSFKWSEVHA